MSDAIAVFNAGSTSLKFAAYALDAIESLPLLCRGGVDSMQVDPHLIANDVIANDAPGKPLDAYAWGKGAAIDHKAAMQFVIHWLEANLPGAKMIAAGHRVVLGDARAFAEAFSGLPRVACFDTPFHRKMPEVAQTCALAKDVRDAGVRHWGCHGISCDGISRQVPKFAPQTRPADHAFPPPTATCPSGSSPPTKNR
jgi:acetate kinase